jgi:hypothetical protein
MQKMFSYILIERGAIMSLLAELIIRVIIIVSVTDVIEFYAIYRNHGIITDPLGIGIIAITIIPVVISIWYCLHRRGIK